MSIRTIARAILNLLPLRLRCLLPSLLRRGRIELGVGSYIHPSVHILGRSNVRIGRNSCISEGTWLNVNHRQDGHTAIAIGDHCFIGKQNFFSSGAAIEIGDYTLTTFGCKFVGSSHVIDDPGVPYLLTGTTATDRICIGVNCFIGAGATVLGNVSVGHGSVIGTDALVLQDIPPFSIAVGNPARVVQRYSFPRQAWVAAAELKAEEVAAMPDEAAYRARLVARAPVVAMPWSAAGKGMGDL
ncbi:MAG TPA: acyltransferase [Rhodocyclaceae bacterium]